MKQLFLSFTVLLFLFACAEQQPAEEAREYDEESVYPPDMHTARIALDYEGTYHGILPCADCEGIETFLEITYEKTFVKKTRYLGKNDEKVFVSEGSFFWHENGFVITLEGEDPPNQYFVSENYLVHLDEQGERITGDLEEKYVLIKQ